MKKKPPDRPRPYAPQYPHPDYKGKIPKLSQNEIIKFAKREGEVLRANRTELQEKKEVIFQSKKNIEQPPREQAETVTPPAQAPPQEQKQPPWQFSEKAKALFAKFRPKAKEQPQQEQTKTKAREKPRER